MFYNLPSIKNVDVKGKTVFLRADLDVPLAKFEIRIEDDTRLKAGLSTIQYLLDNGAKVIIAGHLDRPKGRDKSFSLKPVAKWLSRNFQFLASIRRSGPISNFSPRFGEAGQFPMGFEGWELSENLFLLENLRFYPGEEQNDPEFAQKLAVLAQAYVNDAFAMSHRSHASIVGITRFLPHFAGLHLQKEVEVLSSVLQDPKRPLVVVIGGKKIETKLPLVLKMYNLADYVLVGGKIAQEKASLGSVCERTTHKCANLMVADLNKEGTDLTAKDIEKFLSIIRLAKTVVWNGPMGIINEKLKMKNEKLTDSERGTRMLAKAIAQSGAYKAVGGGDTTEFLKRIGLINKFDFVSTGGGAMLAFLSGEKLPGLEALERR